MEKYLLVIDNGGTNTKAVLFTSQGVQVESSSFATPRIDLPGEKREVDMEQMWMSVCNSISLLLEKTNVKGEEIVGIATVGHGKGLYVVDKEGKVFRNGILSTDNRAHDMVAELQPVAKEISELSKQPILATQSPTLLRWMKKYEPDNYKQIGGILSAKDYVRYRLTGVLNQEETDASGNNFLNLSTRKFDKRLFELFGIEEMWDVMPSLKNANEICGHVTKEVEAITGLKAGTPVVGGMFDIDASAIATQVLDSETLCMVAGTWAINEFLALEPAPLTPGVMNSLFVDGKHYLVESSSATSAGNLDIVLKLLLDNHLVKSDLSQKEMYEAFNKHLKHYDAGANDIMFLPFLYGSNAHPFAKAAFLGLNSDANIMDLFMAVYEGVAFSQRSHMEQLMVVKKTPTRAIRLSGGVVNSLPWVQLFADVLNYPIEIVEANELGALGGAIGAAYGIGLYPSLEEASQSMSRIKQVIQPRSDQVEIYNKKFDRYQRIVKALDTTM